MGYEFLFLSVGKKSCFPWMPGCVLGTREYCPPIQIKKDAHNPLKYLFLEYVFNFFLGVQFSKRFGKMAIDIHLPGNVST
jgi:hypothetical protein